MLQSITFAANTTEANPAIAIGLKTIDTDNSMFMDNGNLRTVNIARDFTYNTSDMIYAPFAECEKITTVNISKGCTTLGKYLFRDCTSIKTVNIAADSQLATIGEDAFRNCEALISIDLPASLTTIEKQAFKDCSALATISSAATKPPTISENSFDDNTYNNAMLVVPNEATYRAAEHWSNFMNILTAESEIEAKIVCRENYILECADTLGWNIAATDTLQAIFTHAVTGAQVVVEGQVMAKTGEGQQHTAVLFYLAQEHAVGTLGEGEHLFTHVEFMKSSADTVAHTTGSVYYNGETCEGYRIYDLANEEWRKDSGIPTHLDDIEADSECTMRIYAAGGNVVVHGAAVGETIAIYDLAGTLCHTSRVDSDVQRIALPARGIYIVRVGARVAKVVI